HNFLLVHGDIMESDVQHRHRPSVWSVFGTLMAILTGDARLAFALQILADSALPGTPKALGGLARSVLRTHKMSLPVVIALGADHPIAGQLRCLYEQPDPSADANPSVGANGGWRSCPARRIGAFRSM